MMIRLFPLLCLALLSAVGTTAQTTFPEEGIKRKASTYLLLTGATVHHADGLVHNADVLIYEGKIKAFGDRAAFETPENTQILDLSGQHLYPSFIDLKSQYGLEGAALSGKTGHREGPQYERLKNTATHWNEAIHPERRAVDHFTPDAKAAEKLRAMGIGMALVVQADGVARGTSALVLTGDDEANKLTLLTQAAAHFAFEKGSSKQAYPSSLMGSIALLRQAIHDARWHAAAPQPETNHSLEALRAQLEGVKIFQGRDRYDLHRISSFADELGLDFIAYEPGHAYAHIGVMSPRIKGLIIPFRTPAPFNTDDPDLLRLVDQGDMLHWEWAPYNALALSEAGVPFAFTAEGFKDEKQFFAALRRSRSLGIPENLVIEAFTTRPASWFGLAHRLGKWEVGYDAHFFAASGDIFTDPEAVVRTHFIGGKMYTASAPPEALLAGRYDLNINNIYLELEITGEHPKHKGRITQVKGSDTLNVDATVTLTGREVALGFPAPGAGGYYRLSASARSQNRIWDGTGNAPSGEAVVWSAIRKVPAAKKSPPGTTAPKGIKPKNGNMQKNGEKATTLTDTATIKAPAIPPMRYPMSAYGFDSLPQPETLLITNATIWTNTAQGVIRNGQLLIHDGRIVGLGKDLNVNELLGSKKPIAHSVYDAAGKHITPGIIDEHSHIALSRGVNEGGQASTAEVRISDALNPADINIFRQLAGGVTTSQLLHGSANPIGGQSAIVKLRWGQPYGKMCFAEAPPFIKFALGENVKQTNRSELNTTRYPQTRMGVEQIFYDYFYRAVEYDEEKKLHESKAQSTPRGKQKKHNEAVAPFRIDEELEALLEILEGRRHITCHSYVQSEINMLMHVADSMGFKVNTFTHILEGYKVADKMVKHGAAGSTFSDWWAYKYEVRDAIPHNASLMQAAGVLVGINSDDAEMGRRLNQEAAKGVRYGGMTDEEALKMITLNPARMLHVDHLVGSLAPGMHADIVVWNSHPLSVYARAEATFVDGCRYFDRSRLEALEQRDRAERARIADLMRSAKSAGAETRKPERAMERYYHCTDLDEQ